MQQNQGKSWAALCRYSPCLQVSGSGLDLKYVRCERTTEFFRRLFHIYDAQQHRTDIQPNTDLVTSQQPFEQMYWISHRIGRGENAARESRLRYRVNDQCFRMCHCTEFFSVPTSERPRFYPTLPTDGVDQETPEDV